MTKFKPFFRGLLAATFLAVALPQTSRSEQLVEPIAASHLVDGLDTMAMKDWRQDFHRHPETAFEEVRTAATVAKLLQSWGIETHTNIGVTGVVGVLRGKGGGSGAICLRADMDALPIKEAPDHVPYASQEEGRMHACGHDGHTAMLLGAAEYLARTRNFSGTVYFIFQPAEEKGTGAKAMIKDDLFEKYSCERIFGMHAWPGLPAGTIGVSEGPITAAADVYSIEISGKGGHAAYPGFANSPVPVAADVIKNLAAYTPKSGETSAVFGVTTVHGGTAPNVIPDKVVLGGTVRTFSPKTRDEIENAIGQISADTAKGQNTEAKVDYTREVSAVINAAAETRTARKAAMEVSGGNVVPTPPTMGAEDFSALSEKIPGAYVALGQAVPGRSQAFLHNSGFDFNDDTLALGASYWVRLVETALPPTPIKITPEIPSP